MTPQYNNKVVSSFLYWTDHILLKLGTAYTNTTGRFVKVTNSYGGLQTYAAPMKQWVADSSITGATIPSGIYLNGNFITPGQSGFSGINYNQGHVYFTGLVAGTITGSFALKDFNVTLTSKPDTELLFETKYQHKNKINYTVTGLQPEELPYPVIFVKNVGGFNEPIALGGMDQSVTEMRMIVIADSEFQLDAVFSIFRDRVRTCIPLMEVSDMPFNSLGGLKTGAYNYESMAATKAPELYIDDIFYGTAGNSKKNQALLNDISRANTEIYPGYIIFTLGDLRFPRQATAT